MSDPGQLAFSLLEDTDGPWDHKESDATKHSTERAALKQRPRPHPPSHGQQIGSAHRAEVRRLSLRFAPKRISVCGSQMVSLDRLQEAASSSRGFKLRCMQPWVTRERETGAGGGWQEVVDAGS